MKLIGVSFFVGLICAASARSPIANLRSDNFNTINQHFIDFLHNERVNFPCGWPDSDIDPIEPYNIEEFDIFIESSSEFSSVDFRMRDADVTGQKHMWIDEFDMRLIGLIMTFTITIPTLRIDGTHTTHGNMLSGLITVPISGEGSVVMDCHNVVVNATGQLRTLPDGNLNMDRLVSNVVLESVDASLTGFGLLDGAVSRMISSNAPGMVNDSQDRITENVGATLLPGINRFLNQHTMTTLVNLMADRNQNPPPRRCFW